MKRILVVDDEPELLEIFREHFEDRYVVDTATSDAPLSSASSASAPTSSSST
jgi:CheY-like chemotaxis protein